MPCRPCSTDFCSLPRCYRTYLGCFPTPLLSPSAKERSLSCWPSQSGGTHPWGLSRVATVATKGGTQLSYPLRFRSRCPSRPRMSSAAGTPGRKRTRRKVEVDTYRIQGESAPTLQGSQMQVFRRSLWCLVKWDGARVLGNILRFYQRFLGAGNWKVETSVCFLWGTKFKIFCLQV